MPREHRGLRLDPVGAGAVGDEDDRIECYKAGDTIIYQINFLMVLAETKETPTIDSSRNEIDFSARPPKGIHDLNPSIPKLSYWSPCAQEEMVSQC